MILLTLPNQDRAYVKGSLTLNEIWSKLLPKYMRSTDAEARRLWSRFSALRQAGRPMVEHVNECMTVKNQLTALGETVPELSWFTTYIMRLSPYLYFVLPVNKRLNFEIPLRLGPFLNVAGTVVIQARHGSR